MSETNAPEIKLSLSADIASLQASIDIIGDAVKMLRAHWPAVADDLVAAILVFDWTSIKVDVEIVEPDIERVGAQSILAHVGPGFELSRLIGKLLPIREDRLSQMATALREFVNAGGEF